MARSKDGMSPGLLRCRDFLVDRRVRLSVALCLGTLAVGLAQGRQPFGIADLPNPVCGGGLLLILCGLGLRSWAAGTLRKGKALTTTGPYRYCRHPLYMGTFLVVTGFALHFPGLATSWPALGLLLVIFLVTARREEQRLARKYGNAWEEYHARSPRWVAVRSSENPGARWSVAQWRQSREYNAVFASVTLLSLFALWHGLAG